MNRNIGILLVVVGLFGPAAADLVLPAPPAIPSSAAVQPIAAASDFRAVPEWPHGIAKDQGCDGPWSPAHPPCVDLMIDDRFFLPVDDAAE
jgi:hypothetical protein